MNKILELVSKKIEEAIKEYLPRISSCDLEEGGKIYYMNGRDGTLFDYYMNNRLTPFIVIKYHKRS